MMSRQTIRAGDITIDYTHMGFYDLSRYFLLAERGTYANAYLDMFPENFQLPGFDPNHRSSDERFGFTLYFGSPAEFFYLAIQMIGYLVSQCSDRFRLFHASGLKIEGKGVIFAGKSGHGKSTLASRLGGNIIDDDTLLVSPSEIQRISLPSYRKKEDGTIEEVFDGHTSSPLNFVFLLNRSFAAGYSKEMPPARIGAETVFPDALGPEKSHPALLELYKQRMPVLFQCPVFEIGTGNGGEQKTVKRVQEILHSES